MDEKFKEGDYIYASWGYDQTNIDFARIESVSKTGKTVVCRMTKVKRVGTSGVQEQLTPTEPYGDEFRLHVRRTHERVCFVGSYPYLPSAKMDDDKRYDVFFRWDGKPVGQTLPQFGH